MASDNLDAEGPIARQTGGEHSGHQSLQVTGERLDGFRDYDRLDAGQTLP